MCVCPSVFCPALYVCIHRGQLLLAIEALRSRAGRRFDYIVIETSGMADPGPVAAELWVDEALESPVRLDGIVTVVDAQHIAQQLVRTCRYIHIYEHQHTYKHTYVQIGWCDLFA